MALERELATLERRSAELAQHAGQFVLVHGDEVVDFFSSYDDALRAGYTRFGLGPFLIRQILRLEPPPSVCSRMTVTRAEAR